MLETLDFTIHLSSTPTFLYFDLYKIDIYEPILYEPILYESVLIIAFSLPSESSMDREFHQRSEVAGRILSGVQKHVAVFVIKP